MGVINGVFLAGINHDTETYSFDFGRNFDPAKSPRQTPAHAAA